MKKRYVILHRLLENFLCGAQGGSYGKGAFFLFFAFCCLVPLVFAGLFHFWGAFWGWAIAAALAALALAHFDAYESEYPAEPETSVRKKSARFSHSGKTQRCSREKIS